MAVDMRLAFGGGGLLLGLVIGAVGMYYYYKNKGTSSMGCGYSALGTKSCGTPKQASTLPVGAGYGGRPYNF